jgi:hypothetical protein
MRPLLDMDTIQIEITNNCPVGCANCTRLVGHHAKPYAMGFDTFTRAVDSLVDFPKMTGMMGGEPLLHPDFEAMCDYLHEKIPPERCGLWTCFPKGFERHRDVIARTFGNVFLNDQTRDDIMHAPILVPPCDLGMESWMAWYLIDKCWVQNTWSASINPHGAFFCEVAAALAMATGQKETAWPVEPGWWRRSPVDFTEQMRAFCPMCGAAMPLRKRASTEKVDDVGQTMLDMLREASPKIRAGRYRLYDKAQGVCVDTRPTATYKDLAYRDRIAERYGMFLTINERGFQTAHLSKRWPT